MSNYIIRARLRHKVTRLAVYEAAQIEFILCEFSGPGLVKATPTAGEISISAGNIVPNNSIAPYTHVHATSALSLSLSFSFSS